MTDSADWVSDVLAGQPAPTIPDTVAARIDEALGLEVERRRLGVAAQDAKRALDEVTERSSLGSFGSNAPTHYDKTGLGIVDEHHAPA